MNFLRKWRNLSAAGLTAAVLLIPVIASAQAGEDFSGLTVALWPEYDRPEVLVIYRMTLPEDLALPATVRVPIPADAPALTAVAYRDPTSGLINAAYDRQDGDAFDTVSIEASVRELQLEYYDPLPIDGAARNYAFVWPGGATIGDFGFEVQQPLAAESFQMTPSASTTGADPLGMVNYGLDLGAVTPADRPSVSLSYQNPSGGLSADLVQTAGPLATPIPSTGGPLQVTSILPWIFLIAGVILIVGGGIYYLRVVRVGERKPRPRHRPSPASKTSVEVDASPVFCHNCGAQATASDRYCRACGTPLRT
jgi:hypothetical protein